MGIIIIICLMVEASGLSLEKVSELVLGKNVDRIERIDKDQYLVASYQLNKDTMEKSGSLAVVKVNQAGKIELVGESEPYDFGVLSLQVYTKEKEILVAIGCSDGCLRIGVLD